MSAAIDGSAAYVERLKRDFVFFVQELWKDRQLDRVAPLGEVELDICLWVATGPRRRGNLAFRSIGKTHFGAAAYSCWRWRRRADDKGIIVSKSARAAKETLALCREWIRSVWFLKDLDPSLNEFASDNLTQFDVATARIDARSPSLSVYGIEGQITGTRADFIIGDDVETPDNTKTQDAREELAHKVSEFAFVASYGARDIIFFGTPHHEESLYWTLADKGYKFRSWPLVFLSEEEHAQSLNLAPLMVEKHDLGEAPLGQSTCPHRFNESAVAEFRDEGELAFTMQCKLLRGLAESKRHPLKLSDLIIMDVPAREAPTSVTYGTQDHSGSTSITDIKCLGFAGDKLYRPAMIGKDWNPYDGTKAGLDPAGRGDDRTGLSVVSSLAGLLWVKCCLGLTGGASTECLDLIASTLRAHDARDLYCEGNIDAFGTYEQALLAALRRHFIAPGADPRFPDGWTCALTVTRATAQKELRIIGTLEPVMSGHRLVVDRAAIMPEGGKVQGELQYQIAHITKQRKCLKEDGKLDSLEIAVRAWQDSIGLEPANAAARKRETKMQDIIREHLEAAGEEISEPNIFTHR